MRVERVRYLQYVLTFFLNALLDLLLDPLTLSGSLALHFTVVGRSTRSTRSTRTTLDLLLAVLTLSRSLVSLYSVFVVFPLHCSSLYCGGYL